MPSRKFSYPMRLIPFKTKFLRLAVAGLLTVICGSCAASRPIAASPLGRNSKVLMVGDSLTVGPFGERIEEWLLQNLGPARVAVYGSCGSSPESWLAANKNFVSSCGYRETTVRRNILLDGKKGRRTQPMAAPKIESLLAAQRPEIVIVQLGTNHYDSLLKGGKGSLTELAETYEKFAKALRPPGGSVRMVIWITPPDSSRFPQWVEDESDKVISATNRRHGYYTFQSRRFTKYVPGTTGSDGVHYNDAGAAQWAAPVIRMLDAAFTKNRIKN
jgi:lysophospholipase L1-like esterase